MSSETALTKMPPGEITDRSPKPFTPQQEIAYATTIANELSKIIESKRLWVKIGQKKHVYVDAWTTLASLRGCTPIEVSNEDIGGGVYVATVELVNADGRVIGRASAECGSENTWKNRDPNARRSMANTRATSKVCRQVFSWVMVLAGYAPTPAEEMEFTQDSAKNAPKSRQDATQDDSGAKWDGSKEVFFGKYSKGPDGPKTWAELPSKYLDWVVENMDSEKGPACKMAQQEIARRALVEAGTVHEGEVLDFGEDESRLPSEKRDQGALDMGPDPDDPRFR